MSAANKFPYQYMGGGWFRERGIPNGEVADMLHGEHAIEFAENRFAAFILLIAIGIQEHERQQGTVNAQQ